MKAPVLVLTVFFLFACAQSAKVETDETREFTDEELVNDEPIGDGSDEITGLELLEKEVKDIDNNASLVQKSFVYQSAVGNVELVLHLLVSPDEEDILKKVTYKTGDPSYFVDVRYYYRDEGKMMCSHLEKQLPADGYHLSATLAYDDGGNVIEFHSTEQNKGETKTSDEFDETFFQETFEGILHFPDANALLRERGSEMVDKEFYIESREDYFDVGEGEIENADQPISTLSEKDYMQLSYDEMILFVRNDDLGQKVSWRTRNTDGDPVIEIPLPAETFFKGAWGNALLFEERGKSGFKLYVYDVATRDFVFNSKISNMKVTDDKRHVVFTRRVMDEDVKFYPICNVESGSNGIGYLEVIHLAKNYSEMKSGQLFCFSRRD